MSLVINDNLNLKIEKIYKYLPITSELDAEDLMHTFELMSVKNLNDNFLFKLLHNKPGNMDIKRIVDIGLDRCWFSKYELLNDPFEITSFSYGKRSKYTGSGGAQTFNNYLNKRCVAVASFSKTYNCMPLWTHYANNHKGICLEYAIENSSRLFEVDYLDKREEEYHSSVSSNTESRIFSRQFCRKSKEWEYEKEVRMIYLDEKRESKGINIECKDMGIKLNKIILGANCSKNNQEIIKVLGESSKDIEFAKAYLSKTKFEIQLRKTSVK